jgi:hypothetical protein
VLLGEGDDFAALAVNLLSFILEFLPYPSNIILPDPDRTRPVQLFVQKAEVDARLECPVDLADSIGCQEQDTLRDRQVWELA